MLLLLRGVPTIYSGDEQGFTGDGDDQDAREDMFASKVAVYNDNQSARHRPTPTRRQFRPEPSAVPRDRHAREAAPRTPGAHVAAAQVLRYRRDKPGLFAVSRFDPGNGRVNPDRVQFRHAALDRQRPGRDRLLRPLPRLPAPAPQPVPCPGSAHAHPSRLRLCRLRCRRNDPVVPSPAPNRPRRAWWRGAAIYQIYPRSFADSNGDGIGDLPGITAHLDHVASLGVDAIWLSPFFPSPMKDFGYDVSDYCDVDPIFGTLDDFDALIARAHALGLRVIIDQVYAHTSDQHPWFVESRASRDNAKADWYVWADAKPDGTPPSNWQSVFGGPAWTLGRSPPPILSAQFPGIPAAAQRPQPRRAAGVAGRRALLAGPGRRWISAWMRSTSRCTTWISATIRPRP
jgi:hypothetical protein